MEQNETSERIAACIGVYKQLLSKSQKKFRSHTLVARGGGPLGGPVSEDCFICW
jgi:hypothetical protein